MTRPGHNPARTPRQRSTSRTRPSSVAAQVHDEQALELRIEGLSVREIAQRQKCAPSTAHQRIERALAVRWRAGAEKAEQVRTVEAERLDQLFAAYWPAALSGDHESALLILKVLDRRARFFGLDAPVKVAAVHVDLESLTEQQLEALVASGGDPSVLALSSAVGSPTEVPACTIVEEPSSP